MRPPFHESDNGLLLMRVTCGSPPAALLDLTCRSVVTGQLGQCQLSSSAPSGMSAGNCWRGLYP